jgi:hypothetical protein
MCSILWSRSCADEGGREMEEEKGTHTPVSIISLVQHMSGDPHSSSQPFPLGERKIKKSMVPWHFSPEQRFERVTTEASGGQWGGWEEEIKSRIPTNKIPPSSRCPVRHIFNRKFGDFEIEWSVWFNGIANQREISLFLQDQDTDSHR